MQFHPQNQLSVVYQPVATLVAYANNARTHSKHQIRQIADSITAFGFTNPILIDKTNTIIAGHGRLRAAQLLGMEQVPTIRLETLTPDQIRAYILADNKLAENAGWDNSILAMEFQHLLTIDETIDVTLSPPTGTRKLIEATAGTGTFPSLLPFKSNLRISSGPPSMTSTYNA
jgi:ParB-like chromosome segregation protein Spo0J